METIKMWAILCLVVSACLVGLMAAGLFTARGCEEIAQERLAACVEACNGPPVVLGSPNDTCYCLRNTGTTPREECRE